MNSGRIRVAVLALADVVCIASVWALVVTAYWALGFAHYDPLAYLQAWPVAVVFVAANLLTRLYHGRGAYPAMPLSPADEFRQLVVNALLTHALVMAYLGFGHGVEHVSRFVLAVSGLLTAATAPLFRDAARSVMRRLSVGRIPAFVVGEGETADRVARLFERDSYYGFRVIRRFGRDELRDVVAAAQAADVRHLFCCYRDDRFFRAQLPDFTRQFTFVEYLPTPLAFPVAGARAVSVGTLGGLEMVNQGRMKALAWEKSVVDCALSLAIFAVTLPLFVIVPVLIKLTSRGPVFYHAERLGKKGRPIRVWKFRSMYADADRRLQSLLDSDPALKAEFERDFKLRHDPRVTPLGRLLRKTSIDELPQLLNVFRRDMALVGPRPIVAKEVRYYGKAFETFSSVKPGITGLWQASGRSDTDYSERVALDILYVMNWSPWLDLWIVYRTVAAVLRMKGSY